MCPTRKTTSPPPALESAAALPCALAGPAPGALAAPLAAALAQRPWQLFVDYDGTLCPIAPRPQEAQLAPALRAVLAALAARRVVGVVSGRALDDLRARVALDGLYYAGNHGFELAAPPGAGALPAPGEDFLPAIAAAAAQLAGSLPRCNGIILENKRYTLSVHYRLAPAHALAQVHAAVHAAAAAGAPRLRLRAGKCVLELVPALDWDKGRAVRALQAAAGVVGGQALFIGDDLTDEDAFRELHGDGIGIVVGAPSHPTAARYRLGDVAQVAAFLHRLADG